MESKRVEEEYQTFMEGNLWPLVYQRIGQQCQSYPYTCIEAKKTENKPLNRYRDVNPYDHSRIILRRKDFVTNYINANLVKMERANRQYILTQGPLVYTSGHFWLMVWEQKSPAIIMLNKIIEKSEIKCHWYWPHENGDNHKVVYPDVNLSITQIREIDFNYYTIRLLKMTCHETEDTREIWHFHYTTWPDFEVPQSPHAFLDFLKRVRDYGALDCSGDKGPAVVHCSAGIGRSGTFCLVDSVMVLIEKEGQDNVDIQEILLEMRRYRMGLIQTSEQLRFSYTAIVEGIRRLNPEYKVDPNKETIYAVVAEEEEAPPPPPPRGESLGVPPARPLPAIPASASVGNIEMSTAADSDESAPPTPPPREALSLPREARDTPSPASSASAYGDDDNVDDDGNTTETTESAENTDNVETASGSGGGDGVRRRRAAELAERVALMKKRSRDADRWHTLKRSLFKPLALSVGLLAVASVLIYAYAKH